MTRDLGRTLGVVEAGIRDGLHVGAQVYALVDGETAADAAMGAARLGDTPRRNVPMTPDSLLVWLSAGKPVTAAAVLLLWERGLLELHESVARYLPEFAPKGKDQITVWQLLTHTAGIRGVDAEYPFATWEETLAGIYAMEMEKHWVPGMRAGYHAHTSWYVLGELIARLTGVRCERWISQNILAPAGMGNTCLAMTSPQYQNYGPRIGWMYDTRKAPPEPVKNLDSELAASRPRPSASCRGPARDLARFYEMLRRGGESEGPRIMKAQTVAAMTMRQREGMLDQTLGQTIDWGLGVAVNSAHYGPRVPYQFGPHASRETFGHGGSQSSVGFCDPHHKLAAAVIFNGRPGEAAHDLRLRQTLAALYEDLDLT